MGRDAAGPFETAPAAGNVGAVPADPRRSVTSKPPRDTGTSAVEVRRSARRSRTVSAYREGDRTIVLIPARMSEAEERRWVGVMLDKLAAKESRSVLGDRELTERARRLSDQYFDGRARPGSVRWVTNQNTRWGSCTPPRAASASPTGSRACPSTSSTTSSCTSWPICSSPATAPGSGGSWRPTPHRAGPGLPGGVAAAERLPNLPDRQDDPDDPDRQDGPDGAREE